MPRTRLRVAVAAHDIHRHGGMENVLAQVVDRLRAEVELTVLSATLAPDLRQGLRWVQVRTPHQPFLAKFGAFYAQAAQAMRSLDVDVVHTCGAIVPARVDLVSMHFCHAARMDVSARPSATTTALARRLNTSASRRVSLAAERRTLRATPPPLATAVSAGLESEIRRYYPDLDVRLVPNGIDTTRFRPDEAQRQTVRGAAGVDDRTVVVLFVGGDWDRKGLEVAVRGTALAAESVPVPLALWVVGFGGGREDRYRRLCDDLGIRARVHFSRNAEDTSPYYCGADILALPSEYETFSLVAHEAAASGVPVVATAVNGVTELLAGDRAGIVCDRTPEAFGAAFAALAADPGRRARMGTVGKELTSQYSWERTSELTLELYRQCAERRAARRRA